jgi:ADP-ribose pyrophosphatase
LFLDEAGRIMLVEPTYKEDWEIPGGNVESGETPVQACAREVREELGLDVVVGRLLVADWAPHPERGDKVLFVFDGGMLTAAQLADITLQADELASYAFFDPTEAAEVLVPRLGCRVAAALEARCTGVTAYLEHGLPHPG